MRAGPRQARWFRPPGMSQHPGAACSWAPPRAATSARLPGGLALARVQRHSALRRHGSAQRAERPRAAARLHPHARALVQAGQRVALPGRRRRRGRAAPAAFARRAERAAARHAAAPRRPHLARAKRPRVLCGRPRPHTDVQPVPALPRLAGVWRRLRCLPPPPSPACQASSAPRAGPALKAPSVRWDGARARRGQLIVL